MLSYFKSPNKFYKDISSAEIFRFSDNAEFQGKRESVTNKKSFLMDRSE